MFVCEHAARRIESHDMSEPSQAILDDRRVYRHSPSAETPGAGKTATRGEIGLAIHDDRALAHAVETLEQRLLGDLPDRRRIFQSAHLAPLEPGSDPALTPL